MDTADISGDHAIILDFDYMEENVNAGDISDLYTAFHDIHFPFFWRTLGNVSQNKLQPSDS